MNDQIPRTESDLVLADVKAKPSGWPPANLDTGLRANSPRPPAGAGQQPKQQTQVSTVSGDCRFGNKSAVKSGGGCNAV